MFETLRNAWKLADLRKKMLYTVMIILVFRVGAAIPVPFMVPEVLGGADIVQGGLLSYFNMLTGGAFASATLFALGISPYITASIIMQLLRVAIPALERLSKEGEAGQKKIARITRYSTFGLSLVMSTAYYIMNRNLRDPETGMSAVRYIEGFAGIFSMFVIILSFTAGAMMIVWLGEAIDKRGVGNGISIILFAGIISGGPRVVMMLRTMWVAAGTEGGAFTRYYALVPGIVIIFFGLITAIVLMNNSERRIPIQYSKRVVGRKMYGGQSSYIPVKVMMSGVMPIIFAGALLSIPGMISAFANPADGWFSTFLGWFDYDHAVYAILYLVLIIAFNYFYVSIQYNPIQMANDLRKNNGAIPGIRPGKPTSDFIAKVIAKITLVGALFLALVAVLPIIFGAIMTLPIALGGTSIIIVVSVALDTVRSLESQMMMRHYKGFLE
ncbi:MAG: preprotein translocase subunit SecY [Oscillospiraceae bacterium]|nr:preprotein translocase subunit SecY [Oscillospiraceae bacterium]